jgi:hypothetical protein
MGSTEASVADAAAAAAAEAEPAGTSALSFRNKIRCGGSKHEYGAMDADSLCQMLEGTSGAHS